MIFRKKNDKILKYLNFRGDFVENVQGNKVSEAQKKAVKKYANSKWRPNVFIDKDKQESIERWFTDHGYKSFNEYICTLIDKDMKDGSN